MITEEQNRFMQMAIDLSQYALDSKNGGPFGAIIVLDGKIKGMSGNCVFRDMDPSAHAEVMAIRDACKNMSTVNLSGCHIYCSSEPCAMCLAAIYWAQISTIYYCNTTDEILQYGYADKSIMEEIYKPKEKRIIESVQISNATALQVLRNILKNRI